MPALVGMTQEGTDPLPAIQLSAGPVLAGSPTVLTPPIPQRVPFVPRGGAPRRPRHPHPT